ncbi:MAG: hypothetical protein ACR2MP_08055 [Streptosporangiaceae bacterium]
MSQHLDVVADDVTMDLQPLFGTFEVPLLHLFGFVIEAWSRW